MNSDQTTMSQPIVPIQPIIKQPTKNRIWSRAIPLVNLGFIIACLVILALDVPMLLSNTETYGQFYTLMWIAFAVSVVLAGIDQAYANKYRMRQSHSLDTAYLVMVVLRGSIAVLNVIPFIQLFGLLADLFMLPVIVIVQIVLLVQRASKP